MEEIICYTPHLPKGTKQNIPFMEFLLDERWAEGEIFCPPGIFQEVGGFNDRLAANQRYEFLLRAVQKYPFIAIGTSDDCVHADGQGAEGSSAPLPADGHCQRQNVPFFPESDGIPLFDCDWEPQSPDPLARYRTDCYIAGKYQQELLSSECFDSVIESLLVEASRLPNYQEAVRWLEDMISHAPQYFQIDDNTRPILIYRGSDTCYNILNLLADRLAGALRSCGQRVIVFDVKEKGNPALTQWIHCRFKAIIGVQSYVFSIMMQDKKTNLHDLIIGPKYNLILDHPAMMREHIENGPKDYYLLLHDRNYVAFAKYYYPNVKDCIYFPPGGALPWEDDGQMPTEMQHQSQELFKEPVQRQKPPQHQKPVQHQRPAQTLPAIQGFHAEKQYDITFIGSYYNYRDRLFHIASFERPIRFLAARFLLFMRREPDRPAEQAFQKALDYYHIALDDDGFLSLFFELRQACFCIMHYYREKIIRTLLDAGIEIHVYGSTWQNAPFFGHEKLICHPALGAEESLLIMAKSKISLNIMSWHKDGLTERVLNAMLCRSVILSDWSSALEENFIDGRDLLLFSLNRLHQLPGLVKEMLADNAGLEAMAEHGFEKAFANHQWKNRAEKFLKDLRNRS